MDTPTPKPKFFLTTPIYYVNARPHLGHTYTTIVADTIARYKQMRGYDVVLLTGTDEHGQKVERSAKAAGVAPQQFADNIADEYRRLWDELDLRIDRFELGMVVPTGRHFFYSGRGEIEHVELHDDVFLAG
mgnify:CR=1 FL=1